MVGLEIEAQLAKEAQKRMLAGEKLDPPQIFAEGESREQAAKLDEPHHPFRP
jgi:hypothetical protein